jgi:hypothetical protein
MAVLALQEVVRTGLNPSLGAAAEAGDSFPNDGRVYLRVKNAHADQARTVTVASQKAASAVPQGTAKADVVVAVPGTQERWIGPFDPTAFNDANGRCVVTYDEHADVTVGAIKLP